MEIVPNVRSCAICGREALCCNYGVLSCDPCKMFFRRCVTDNIIYECNKNGDCPQSRLSKGYRVCKGCRLRTCAERGMRKVSIPTMKGLLKSDKDYEMAKEVKKLLENYVESNKVLMTSYTSEDIDLDEILRRRFVNFRIKTDDDVITPNDWSLYRTYLCIQYFMSFPFMSRLSLEDQKLLFRETAVKICLLRAGFDALISGRDRVTTPDGQDVYPEELRKFAKCPPETLNRIRSEIVGKMIELRISEEEFVLLQMIMFCNPGILSFSPEACKILSVEQVKYTSYLMKVCQNKYGKAGPSRMHDLFTIITVIHTTYRDACIVLMAFQMEVPTFRFPALTCDTFDLSRNPVVKQEIVKKEEPE